MSDQASTDVAETSAEVPPTTPAPSTSNPSAASGASPEMGTFDEQGDYTPRQVIANDLGDMSIDDAYTASMVDVEDGQLVEGVVVKVDRDEVLLDIGYKSEGVIPSRELSIRNDVDPNEIVNMGERIEALVLQKEDKEGRLLLSKKRAQYERAWGTIEALKEADGVVSGPVIEVVKGGLIIDIGLRGFLPASLVELRRVRDLQPYVGRTLEAKIIELDKNRNNVVLSRRAWLEETQKEQREDFLTNLKPGEIRQGVVSSVVNFGAFVDLGGMDGLVHVSELSWKHVDHPGSVVAVGDEITVQVLEVDLDRERISLSLKATQQDPWQEFAGNHRVGELVYGRVTKLVPFGSFVQVGDGIEGLVHISEMSAHHVELPEQVVTPGEELWVKIIDLDLQRRRISLSIKQAAEGGVVAAEYQEHFGEHAYDDEGNYIGGPTVDADPDAAVPSDAEEAWAEYYHEHPDGAVPGGTAPMDPNIAAGSAEGVAEEPTGLAEEPTGVADEAAAPDAAPDED
ncbi:MAG: 30S ribosomal protein S1 [Acidimicrobiales bacterium]|nr:30S ribosomal protein S1 [Acidimicrobiales bacterium]